MIICLTKTTGGTVGVNLNFVTYIEGYSYHSEVHFPDTYIKVKETLDEIVRKLDCQNLIKEIRR